MQRLLNEASQFREEMICGYTTAFGRYLRRVPGASGVIANGAPAQPVHVRMRCSGSACADDPLPRLARAASVTCVRSWTAKPRADPSCA